MLLRLVVAALCATAAIAIFALVTGNFDDGKSWRVLATTSAVSFFALLSVASGVLLERGRAVALARASGALTATAFVLTLVVTWTPGSHTALWRAWGVALTLAVAAAQAAIVEARRRDSDSPTIVRLAGSSVLTGGALAALGTLAILTSIDSSTYYRLVGALGVLDVLLLAVVAVLRRSAGPIGQTHRLRVNGQFVEAPGRDFAAAVAEAIRSAEREGVEVRRIERL
jgi:hypothetical protein